MVRHYKLSANFNTVELEIEKDDLLDYVRQEEWDFDEEIQEFVHEVPSEQLLQRLLQKEYDILAGISTVAPVNTAPVKPEDRPSEKQIEWARNLGMKNPESRSKAEVSDFIRKNKDK